MKPSERQRLREEVERALYEWEDGDYDDASEALDELEELQKRLPTSEKALHERLVATLTEAAETIDDYEYEPGEGG